MPRMYPLLFETSLHQKVWGGQWLESQLGKELPAKQPIGESWEIYWKNRVTNGPFRGRSLGDLITQYPLEMLGKPETDGEFPLLVKFIDAQDWLSVQVHPDDALAAQLENEPRGKTECWYIIHAKPDAQIAYGLAEALNADTFRAAIAAGRTQDVLQYVNVAAGDFIYVPAGTLHAIGPGILLYELQQTSDTTYRVYDWDRPGLDGKPRELHLDKSLLAAHYDVKPPARIVYRPETLEDGVERAVLIREKYFSLEKWTLSKDSVFSTRGLHPHLLTAIAGHIEWRGIANQPIVLPQGTSTFIPAGIGDYRLIPDGEASVLCAWPTA